MSTSAAETALLHHNTAPNRAVRRAAIPTRETLPSVLMGPPEGGVLPTANRW
jgi:hypothetical protein